MNPWVQVILRLVLWNLALTVILPGEVPMALYLIVGWTGNAVVIAISPPPKRPPVRT